MSASGLSSEAQLRYLLQWFSEFSELQREDFLPVLAAARSEQHDQLASAMAAITCHDKPVNLFQCRIKLFNEWYPTWSEDERGRLLKGVTEMDLDFGKKLQECETNGALVNGDFNGMNGVPSPDATESNDIGAPGHNEIIEHVQEVHDLVEIINEPVPEINEPVAENNAASQESNIDDEEKETNHAEEHVPDNIPVEIAAAT